VKPWAEIMEEIPTDRSAATCAVFKGFTGLVFDPYLFSLEVHAALADDLSDRAVFGETFANLDQVSF
jgi:hypothetical protein